mmetsp:Transcript_94968/g.268242  ORF Transcript_94968/g.268242 Transcript_94968/m.268242 type:complete len:203 (+) Transcript_94968:467-1075(+)
MMATDESAKFAKRYGQPPRGAGTKVRQETQCRPKMPRSFSATELASRASRTLTDPTCVPASKKSPVSSKVMAVTAASNFNRFSDRPLSRPTTRSMACALATTKELSSRGSCAAASTADESVNTLSRLPDTHHMRTDLSIDAVIRWSSRLVKVMCVIGRVWPCSRQCTSAPECPTAPASGDVSLRPGSPSSNISSSLSVLYTL